jgi:beta-glucosidase
MIHYLTTEQETQIESWLSQLTLDEKIKLLSGADTWSTQAIPRLEIPEVIMTDGPHGVRPDRASAKRPYGVTTAFPTGIGIAATWDRELVHELGAALAEETRAMGCDVLLGPCVNILRAPLGGRNFETYSEDPYLAGEIGLNWVLGLQGKGVGASLKHYAGNDQEYERMRINIVVSERALREIYLAPFEKIVRHAQPWTVMAAYPRVNGTFATESHYLLRELLKQEWGFEGTAVSDWSALHSTAPALNAGLDLEMPGPAKWRGGLLKEAVQYWQVSEETLEDAVRRVLRLIVRCMPGKVPANPHLASPVAHRQLAREIASESITLLKNEGNLLPIQDSVRKIAVIGLNAMLTVTGGGSSRVLGSEWITPLQGLREALADQAEIIYEPGDDNRVTAQPIEAKFFSQPDGSRGLQVKLYPNPDFQGEPLIKHVPALDEWWGGASPAPGAIDGHAFSAVWEGQYTAAVSGLTPFMLVGNGYSRLYIDENLVVENNNGDVVPDYGNYGPVMVGESIDLEAGQTYPLRVEYSYQTEAGFAMLQLWHKPPYVPADGHARAVNAAAAAELAIVVVGSPDAYETEGLDRPSMRLTGNQDELVAEVVQANPNTVVVVNSGTSVEMPWVNQVPAILWAYFPGQEGGHALADILTGVVNPSGKLPLTLPARIEDNPTFINYPGDRSILYGEDIFIGYRYYDARKIEPLFPFGHGLSYTHFTYSKLNCPPSIRQGEPVEISFTIRNDGNRSGSEVAQVYLHDVQSRVPRPPRELKGFKRVFLDPGAEVRLTVRLDEHAFSFYDQDLHQWIAEPGYFEIHVGSSSRDIRLSASVKLEA